MGKCTVISLHDANLISFPWEFIAIYWMIQVGITWCIDPSPGISPNIEIAANTIKRPV